MKIHDLANLDHDHELAKALGNMVVAWAHAETALTFTFAAICGIDVNMATIGYHRIPTFEARTKFVRGLITEWTTTKYKKQAIDDAIDKLAALSITRNEWVHGLWCINRDANETMVFNFKREAESGRRKPVKATDVNQHVEAVRRRTNALRKLIPDVP
jgi:hypothetical protein